MSEVLESKGELTLHNFSLFHLVLKSQSKADTCNSTPQLNERLVNHHRIGALPLKKACPQRENTMYVNMGKAACEC